MADSEPVTDQPIAPGEDADPDEHRSSGHAGRRRRSRGLGFLRETAIIVVSALVLSWLIKSFLVQAFFIPSASMEDTLIEGDRVMVSRLVPTVLDVHRGDVVVFKDPGGWLDPVEPVDHGPVGNAITDVMTFVGLLPQDTGEHLIKRVIGVPGDQVTCCDAEGRVSVNGVPIDEERYVKPGSEPSEVDFAVTVPDGMLFVMGDNRQNSRDSRYNTGNPGGGFVPMSNVVGTAFATVWPFDRATLLRNPGDVFAGVPEP
ncbi:signal peptidase I [Isoptericola variabilis]|uniref:Signal peptidase I n=1 Tax=Isoptericola variabilis (strain 225) TaxID=743718 RepID=F6FRV9_ISOV2|nr:signal peptidase I [Isoptericola variabilis]AEG43960.1 signal peptidase I [Isoptericola variabilis 225]TWH30555.1 signal peptidase I [Isoptericola variabilis J7]